MKENIHLNFIILKQEIESILEREKTITLATSANNYVTARTMSHINDGLNLYIQTDRFSTKVEQISANNRIALAVGHMSIEAYVEILGHPNTYELYIEKFKCKYPQYYITYTNLPDEILIKAIPTKITLYKYIDNLPCKDVLDNVTIAAYREIIVNN